MLITLSVPDNTVLLKYAQVAEDGTYIQEDKPVTAGMVVEVKAE